MSGFKILEESALKIRKYCTPIGTLWYFVNFVFRHLVAVNGIGKNIYSDGLKEFTCDTRMPGCENVCHNLFLPIVLDRFWNIEFIFICSPTIFFVAYAAYTNTRLDAAIANDKRPDGIDDNDYIKHLDTRLGMKRKKTYFDGKDYRQGTYFWTVEEKICYMFHLIIRVLLEFIFIAFAYWIQVQQNKKSDFWDVWEVPERFVCEHGKTVSEPRLSPCWTDETVTCWIARPREKTLAVKYMFGIQILSIILTVTELIFETTKWASKKITRAKPMNDYGQPPAPAALPTAPLTALSYEIKKGSTEEPFLGEKDAKHE